MADDVIALFPLGLVLLPTSRLPIHVFEQRYRQMISEIGSAGADGSFGVVALTRGVEVRSSEFQDTAQLAEVGTIAEIVQVHRYDDGACDLLTVGSRRFRIRQLVTDAPYPRAAVEYLDEPEGELSANHVAAVRKLAQRHSEIIARLRHEEISDEPLPEDPWLLSYQLGARLPIPLPDRQALLETPTTAARLERLAALLRRELALLRRTRSVAVLPGSIQLIARPN